MKKAKKAINVVYESVTPDSHEAQYISKLIDMAEISPVVRLKETLTDSEGGRIYKFEIDEGYIGSWERYKYEAKQEVGYDV